MTRTHGTTELWLSGLRTEGTKLLTAVGQPGVLATPVPSCPTWTLAEMVRHLGGLYAWVRQYGQSPDPTQPWPARDPSVPVPDDQVVAWYANELPQVIALLEAVDPEQPMWNWAPQAKKAAFWPRRLVHETAVHRWDAQLATGLPEPIEARLAGDTVSEVLDTFLPAGRRRSADLSGLVHLVATDLGQEWFVRLRGAGVALLDTDTLLDDDDHPARAAASCTASDLALALWGRVTFEVCETAGDTLLLEALRVA